jgi:hypothetical protein
MTTEPTNTNGQHKGRKVPPLPTFTFKSIGVTVSIRRLGTFAMDDIRKTLTKERKRPEPPTVVVEVGDMAVKMREPNPNDPTYKEQLAEYDNWLATTVAERMLGLMANYCIVCEVEDEIVEDRRIMLSMISPELNQEYSDREVYVRHYLLSDAKELQEVQAFILGQSMPTQEAVDAHIDTFQRDIPGEAPVSTPGTPIRLPIQ